MSQRVKFMAGATTALTVLAALASSPVPSQTPAASPTSAPAQTAAPSPAPGAPASGAPAASPSAPSATADFPFDKGKAADGATKSAVCSACHGPNGNSTNPDWPRLAGQNAVYVAEQLRLFRSGVRSNPTMTSSGLLQLTVGSSV